jgi:hypothetical protein
VNYWAKYTSKSTFLEPVADFSKFSFILFMTLNIHAQNFGELNIDILSSQLAYADPSILQTWKKESMFYVDSNDKIIIPKGFDIAYPFFKKAALVKEGEKYGVIDKRGDFLLPLEYDKVDVGPFDNESHLVILDGKTIFNLNDGKLASYYTRGEEPDSSENYILSNPDDPNGTSQNERSTNPTRYDSVITFCPDFIIAKKNGKIGVLGSDGKIILDFVFDNATFSESVYTGWTYPIFGLELNGVWNYFKKEKAILKSKYRCVSFGTLLPNSVGVVKKRNKHFVLFEDGGTNKRGYDFISENGLVGIRKKNVYVLKTKRSGRLCYRRK